MGKRTFAAIIVICLLLLAYGITHINLVHSNEIIYGDVDNSGEVDVGDAILVLRDIVGLINITENYGMEAMIRADVDGSGEVDVGDAILILRYIVGLIDEFPVTQPASYTLTYLAGANGSLSGETTQVVLLGHTGSPVFPAPDEGYAFWKWSDDFEESVRADENVTADITATALFEPLYILELRPSDPDGVYAPERGSVTDRGDEDIMLREGESIFLQAVENPGFTFVSWNCEDTDVVISKDDAFEFVMPGNNTGLYATFMEGEPYSLKYKAGANGQLRHYQGDGTLYDGIVQEVDYFEHGPVVQAVPNSGYLFDSWSDGRKNNPRQELYVSRDFNLTATFVEIPDILKMPPQLRPSQSGNYAGNDLNIFAESGFFHSVLWLQQVDEIWVNGIELESHQYSKELGKIVLKTSLIPELQVPGDHTIEFLNEGYAPSTFTQTITAGEAHEMVIAAQPQGPSTIEGFFQVFPIIHIMDAYGNHCEDGPSAETSVTVSRDLLGSGGSWELGGTLTITTYKGVAVFGDLTAVNHGMMPVTDARLIFNSNGLAQKMSTNFTIGSSALFNEVQVLPDETDNFAGANLELPYNLGHYTGNWASNVKLKVNGTEIERFVPSPGGFDTLWSVSSTNRIVRIHTHNIPELQTKGFYQLTFEAPDYETAQVMQEITAGHAAGIRLVKWPVGPDYEPPNTLRRLTQNPELIIVDKYGNLCDNGPSGDENYDIRARHYEPVNWSANVATARSENGRAIFGCGLSSSVITVRNDTRSHATGRFIFNCPDIVTTDPFGFEIEAIAISASFNIPRGLSPAPNLSLQGQPLAGDPIAVNVEDAASSWLNTWEGREFYLNGHLLDGTQYDAVPGGYILYPNRIPSGTERGSYTLLIKTQGHVDAKLDFHVQANRAERIVPHRNSYIGPHVKDIENLGQRTRFVIPLRVKILDRWENLCVDGPSSSGVYVSVSKGGNEYYESERYEFVTPASERTVEAVDGIASFPGLRVKATGDNRLFNTRAVLALSSAGLEPLGELAGRPTAIMANWYTETYKQGSAGGYTTPDTTNNKPHETITVKILPRLASHEVPDWFNNIQFVTVNDKRVDSGAMEKELIDDVILSLDIDTSKVPELQVAGSHTICVYAIEGYPSLITGGWYPESFLVQTIEPGSPHSIQVVQQPEDQTQRGESIEVKVEVKDKGGNLTPAYVYAEPANPDQWSLGGTTAVNAGGGEATFTIRANSNIYNDELNEIRFRVVVDGVDVTQLSEPFYVLAKERD